MTQNRHLRLQKIRGFGLGRTRAESADSVADSESVTTLDISHGSSQLELVTSDCSATELKP